MDIKTVDDSRLLDPLYQRQKEGVAKMRTSLLAYTEENGVSTRQALESITAMRVYHQLTRIVKYLELMDKLENKLYESIEYSIDNSSSSDPTTWAALLNIQAQLQKSMIESHKLIQPYLDIQDFGVVELAPQADTSTNNNTTFAMSSEARDSLRSKAQNVLLELQSACPELAEDNNGA